MKVVSKEDLCELSKFTVEGGKYAGMKLGDYFDDVEQEAYTKAEVIAMFKELKHTIEFEEKWLLDANAYSADVDIAFHAIKSKIKALGG